MSAMHEDSAEQPDRPGQPTGRRERDSRTGSDAAATRIQHQARWVDLQVQWAMERGEFDDLPGKGKPLGDLGSPYDRDWWLKKLIDREQVTVLPEALMLRKDDAELDGLLDRERAERVVRGLIEEFNRRIVAARRQLQGGPPVVTPTRDVDTEVERWRERRRRRPGPVEGRPSECPPREGPAREKSRRHWFRLGQRRDDA